MLRKFLPEYLAHREHSANEASVAALIVAAIIVTAVICVILWNVPNSSLSHPQTIWMASS